eukprot:4470140-Pleurochrysis_carterae.AAC.1
MSVTQVLFDTAYVFDGSVDAIDGGMAEASVNKIFELPIELPNLPLARSTVSFSPVTAYTK